MEKRTKKAAGKVPARKAAYTALHGLLDTLRTFSSYEDEVCLLLHEVERKGKLGSRSRRQLEDLLQALPGDCLLREMEMLRRVLDEAAA